MGNLAASPIRFSITTGYRPVFNIRQQSFIALSTGGHLKGQVQSLAILNFVDTDKLVRLVY